MEEEIVCMVCGWTGDSTMLVSKTDHLDDHDYNYCPDCGSGQIEDFESVFGETYIDVHDRTYYKTKIDRALNVDSVFWNNNLYKNRARLKIADFVIDGCSGNSSSITPLFPFEIMLINDGFEVDVFCELNSYYPCRIYKKKDKQIYVCFGIEIDGKRTNFYFETNYLSGVYQLDNDPKNYHAAINGQLKNLS